LLRPLHQVELEDIEDIDAWLNETAHTGGLKGDLAAKLAKFEAMMDDD